jgi:hypothetical protein
MKRAEYLRELAQASMGIPKNFEEAAKAFERNDHTKGIQFILKAEEVMSNVQDKFKQIYDD